MTLTALYIDALTRLKHGDLGLLRGHALKGLDESLQGFDLFTGLWWPLREKSPKTPRREVAWLVAKLYAFRPLPLSHDDTLAMRLGACAPPFGMARQRFQQRFDAMLGLPLDRIEPVLQWALDTIAERGGGLDWVRLTDDLWIWEQESKRLEWAKQYIDTSERRQ